MSEVVVTVLVAPEVVAVVPEVVVTVLVSSEVMLVVPEVPLHSIDN